MGSKGGVAETCIEETRRTGGEGGFRLHLTELSWIRGDEWAVLIKALNFRVPYVLVC